MRNRETVFKALQAGDPDAFIRDARVRSLYWPYYFVKVVMNNPDVVEHFHGQELERFTERMISGQFRQWIEWPRGHFKTTCFTLGFGVWLVLPWTEDDVQYAVEVLGLEEYLVRRRFALHNQDLAQLLAFENADNARLKMSEIRTHFEQNQLFRAAFPEIAYNGTEKPWNDESIKIRRTPKGFQTGEGTFDAIGVGGALQSRHYDIVWGDDLVGKAATESATIMESTIRWFGLLNGALRGRARGAQSCIFGVSNRWGYYDLNSEVQKSGQFLFHRRAVTEFDEQKQADIFVFPERFNEQVLAEIKNSPGMNRYDFQCQYHNAPLSPGDNEVDGSLIHRYKVTPEGLIQCSCGELVFPSDLMRFMHFDPYNAKGVRSTSAPAIVVVGTSETKHIYILDYFVSRSEYSKIYEQIVKYNDTWWPEVMTYEDVGNQNMCEFHLKQLQLTEEFKKAGHKRFRSIRPATTKGKAKEVRVRDYLFPYIERGNVSCRAGHTSFLQMIETWPHRVEGHDYDLLDALAQGPAVWRYPMADDVRVAAEIAEAAEVANLGKPYGWTA